MNWGALLHLGANMWDDFLDDPDGWAKSREDEVHRPNPMGPSEKPKRSRYHSYLTCDDAIWKDNVDHCASEGLNTVLIDLGEGVCYPSHPELAETHNGLAGFLALEDAGFDQLPCGSNWNNDRNMGLLVDFCRQRIAPSRLKGFLVAPWDMSATQKDSEHTRAGISQLAEAKRHHENPV